MHLQKAILHGLENGKMKTRHLRIQDAGFRIGKKEEVVKIISFCNLLSQCPVQAFRKCRSLYG